MASDTPLLVKLQTELRQSQTPSGSENDLSSSEYLNISESGGGNGMSSLLVAGSQSTSSASLSGSTEGVNMNNVAVNAMNIRDMNTRLNNVLQPKVMNNLMAMKMAANMQQQQVKGDQHELLRKLLDLPPPPSYADLDSNQSDQTSKGDEGDGSGGDRVTPRGSVISQSVSQPDLRSYEHQAVQPKPPQNNDTTPGAERGEGRELGQAECENIAQKATYMVHVLYKENASLREELDMYYKKVSRLQKLEVEIQKIQKDHDSLHKSSERRERLERQVRARLEHEVRALRQQNTELKCQLPKTPGLDRSGATTLASNESELRKELNRRDVMISQLLSESKELQDIKERMEMELSAQRATLTEQRQHIDILDSALTNTQASVVKLEEELRRKQMYVEKVEQLQSALTSLQQAGERREATEKRLRGRLEQTVGELRARLDEGSTSELSVNDDETDVANLLRKLNEKEEKIIQLENDITKIEQQYLEENAMRQLVLDAAAVPRDAKIEALEKNSQESERWMSEARNERLKHMDEIYDLNKRNADIEGRLQLLHTQLAEKDAMIRVLQRHTAEKDAAFEAILRSPRHSPHSSIPAHSSPMSSHSSPITSHSSPITSHSSPMTSHSSPMTASNPSHTPLSSQPRAIPSSNSTTFPSHSHSHSLSHPYSHSPTSHSHSHSHSSITYDISNAGYRYGAGGRPVSATERGVNKEDVKREVLSRQTWIV